MDSTDFPANEDLDVLLRQWRVVNLLSLEEARGIKSRAQNGAQSSTPQLDVRWWKECLGAGYKPRSAKFNPYRFAFPKLGLSS
jgi:hypothetical protein